MIEYQEIFLEKIKALLSYFIKLKKDNIILSKKIFRQLHYWGNSDWQLIIIIINDKNIFFINDSYQKIWIFKRYRIFYFKRKKCV